MLTIDNHTTGETIPGTGSWEFQDSVVYADIGAGVTSSAWCDATWPAVSANTAGDPDLVNLQGGLLTVTVSHPASAVSCDWFIFPG